MAIEKSRGNGSVWRRCGEIRNLMQADWRGNRIKQREVRLAPRGVLGDDPRLPAIFEIVEHQRDY